MDGIRLDSPLRIFWDVNIRESSASPLSLADVLKIADRVIACSPFFLNLGEDILNYEHLSALIDKFKTAGIKLSLASSSLVKPDKDFSFLKDSRIDFLEFNLNPHIDKAINDKSYLNKIRETLKIYADITKKVCPSLVLTSENYLALPLMLDFLIKEGVKYFKMPNTFINDRTAEKVPLELLKSDDLEKLRDLLRDKVDFYKANMEFFIHDLFIFKLFFTKKGDKMMRAEYSGCQAGNTLCYIDPKGDLYLCSSLYVTLGSVLEHDIKTLFKNEKRAHFRGKIEEQFSNECVHCFDFSECRGGCRGVVYFMNDSFTALDPLCPHAKRKKGKE